ncbi:hypothetical protein [Kitasatospora sp. NPDC085879]|uniref:hypothetical protein n=1 Tax=Kitasatospora sp. NPDC085879 TaxID=3154769 RepID=UPI00342E012C
MAVLASVVLALTAGSLSTAGGAPVQTERANIDGAASAFVLVDVPTDLADAPRARHYIIDKLTPGTTIQRRVEVTTSTDSLLHVELHAGAADIKDGSFVGASGRTANLLPLGCTCGRTELD